MVVSYLVESKTVKMEISHTVILPSTISVLCSSLLELKILKDAKTK